MISLVALERRAVAHSKVRNEELLSMLIVLRVAAPFSCGAGTLA